MNIMNANEVRMRDKFGTVINVGDFIVYAAHTYHTAYLRFGKVSRTEDDCLVVQSADGRGHRLRGSAEVMVVRVSTSMLKLEGFPVEQQWVVEGQSAPGG